MVGASAALEEAGGQKWTVDRVLEEHKAGTDVKKALEDPARRVLLRREVDRRLGDGRAEFDAKLLLQELPQARFGGARGEGARAGEGGRCRRRRGAVLFCAGAFGGGFSERGRSGETRCEKLRRQTRFPPPFRTRARSCTLS
jgi:hypothetical protein